MAGLYAVEVEPEVRSWLARLSDREFGRADFLVGLLAEQADTLGEPYTRQTFLRWPHRAAEPDASIATGAALGWWHDHPVVLQRHVSCGCT